MKAKSVMKKIKTTSFAAKVDREECRRDAALIGMELNELIGFIIPVLEAHKEELGLVGELW